MAGKTYNPDLGARPKRYTSSGKRSYDPDLNQDVPTPGPLQNVGSSAPKPPPIARQYQTELATRFKARPIPPTRG